MNRERVFEILLSGDFDHFVGAVEDEWFECKGEPYMLGTDGSKRELAKDVSGLANSDGGVIVIGLRTQRNASTLGDEVEKVRPFAQILVDLEQYRNVLRLWTFPSLANVTMQWHPSSKDSTKGLVSIGVPVPDERDLPYLIVRTIEDEAHVTDTMIGFAERRRDSVHHKTVHDIHALLRRGQQYDTLSPRFDRVEELIKGVLRAMPQEASIVPPRMSDEVVVGRLGNSIEEAGLNSQPSYSLFCYPSEQLEIPDLFASRQSQFASLLRHPPQLRPMGFNLNAGEEPINVRGSLWRTGRGRGRRTLELWKDGTMFFIASGDDDFLCWGQPVSGRLNNPVNPFVLVETAYLFCELVRQVFQAIRQTPLDLRIGISLNNIKSDAFHAYMLPHRPGTAGWDFRDEKHVAPEDRAFLPISISTAMLPERGSFLLVSALYEWFGFLHEAIPFVGKRDGESIIDIAAMR